MGKALLAYPNRLADVVPTHGLWSPTLPASHLATRQLSQVARSLVTDKRTSYVYLDAGASIGCSVAALCNHNLSPGAGQWRLRGFASDPRPASAWNFRAGVLPSGVTYSRASAATYFDASGVLQTAAVDAPRWSYSGGKIVGLICEPAAINYCLNSRNLAAWTLASASATLTATGLDGSANSASRLSATSANGRCYQVAGIVGTSCVWSVYVRRVSGTGTVRLSVDNFASTTVVSVTASWTRVQMVGVTGSHIGIQIDTSGDVIEVDCCQLESTGVLPSSPIITTGATVTRSPDVLTMAAPVVDPIDGALVFDGQMLRLPASSSAALVSATAGTSAATFSVTSAGVLRADYTTASVLQASINGSTIAAGATVSMALTWASNDVRLATNGALGTPDVSASMGSGTSGSITIGSGSGGSSLVITELRTYGSAWSDADLQALTGADGEIVPSYDSGAVDAYPAAWIAATSAEQRSGVRYPSPIVPASAPSARYWRVDLIDESNAAGYLEAGRIFIGGAISTTYNAQYGATLGYRDRSSSIEAFDGAEYFDDRRIPREMVLTWPVLTDGEALLGVLELQRQQGTTREVLVMWDRSDTTYAPARTFLGRLTSLSPVRAAAYGINEAAVAVKELL